MVSAGSVNFQYTRLSTYLQKSSLIVNINKDATTSTVTPNGTFINQVSGIITITNTQETVLLDGNIIFSAGTPIIRNSDDFSNSYATVSATTSNSTQFVTTQNVAGISIGMTISGGTPNIDGFPIVVSKVGTTITLSTAQSLNAGLVINFKYPTNYTYLKAIRIG